VIAGLVTAAALSQFCPSYTASSPEGMAADCAVNAANGTNPTVSQWQSIFALVSGGPAAWGTAGPSSVPMLGQGCGKPMPTVQVAAKFPCELLKAIAMQESSWKQFCVPTTPSSQVGGASRTIISFDCGYGIGQVTSGMRTFDATPSYDRARVANDATYNLATGTQILAQKWRATNCVGDNQPRIVEHWYTAAWAYNGLAQSNNPNNPAYSSTRGVYNPSVGGSRPYQEKVFGWMEHPPTAGHWPVLAPAYPRLTDIGSVSSPPDLPEPTCASPTSCAATRSTHVSSCLGGGTAGGSGAGGGAAGGATAGGATAGGATAGGATAGGATAGGATAGGATAGGATAGGSGAAGGSEAGGGEAGGSAVAAGGSAQAGGLEPVVWNDKGCGCSTNGGLMLFALLALVRRRP